MRILSYALATCLLALGLAGQANTANPGFTGTPALLKASLSALALTGAGTAVGNDSKRGVHLASLRIPGRVLAMNGLERPRPKP